MLPVHVVPVNPLTHTHCDDEQTVLASKSVQCEANVQAMPTIAEMVIMIMYCTPYMYILCTCKVYNTTGNS